MAVETGSNDTPLSSIGQDYFIEATLYPAIAVYDFIKKGGFQSTDRQLLDKETIARRRVLVDEVGMGAMAWALRDGPGNESFGSEGRKELAKYGETGAMLQGTYGKEPVILCSVSDCVEGTDAAMFNLPGAVSAIALTRHGHLIGTPEGIWATDYMDKFFGPPQLQDRGISLENSHDENLSIVQKVLGIKPEQIEVVVLDRPRNERLMDRAEAFGARLRRITAGDFMPAVRASMALTDDDIDRRGIQLVMGIGGWEEGVMAATAARVLGGVALGQGWSADPDILSHYTKLGQLELVTAEPEDCWLSVTAITGGDKDFNLPKVEKTGGFETHTMLVGYGDLKLDIRNFRPPNFTLETIVEECLQRR